jgi:hypothetical protein
MCRIIGDCNFCNGEVISKEVSINNKKVNLYICTNNITKYNDNYEEWEESEDSTCNFKVFSNTLLKYNKAKLSEKEMKKLLKEKELEVRLYSKKLFNEETQKYGSEYFKYLVLDKDYGVSVIFD